jgi:putative effector of murein hydrolase LrgA (UPF0299 family)
MAMYSVWKDLIKPTIIAYIIACTIPGGIAGVYYLYLFLDYPGTYVGVLNCSGILIPNMGRDICI